MRFIFKYTTFILVCLMAFTYSFGQFNYIPYYGKNKVIYDQFNWSRYSTEHFDIYYYADDVEVLKTVAQLAESAYTRISHVLKHQLSASVPLIFYQTFNDFEQTNLFPVREGVLGVSEPVLYRVAIHGDMSTDELQDLIEHELTHIFEFDLLWGSPGGALYAVRQPPLWVMEGFAEYNTRSWSPWSELIVRDAVLNDRIPELKKSGELSSRYPLPRNPAYDFGHALYEFIESKYGEHGIREFWQNMKHSSLLSREVPVKKVFGEKPKILNHEFKKYLRSQNKKFLMRENPENYSIPLGPEFPMNSYLFSFSHALSPSGDIVAALTYNVRSNDMDIILISTKDGSIIKNITKGYTLRYEHIKYQPLSPSQGKKIAWSGDGDRIAFFARKGEKHSLFIMNPLSGQTIKQIKISQNQPNSPCFFPESRELLYTGYKEGKKDIFKINLQTEKSINLTQNDLYEKAPDVSPDGQYVAYTIRIETYDKIFLSPVHDFKKKTQLTFGQHNTINPEFSPDSKKIYFSGDMKGAFNLYSLHLNTGVLKRYTDVQTGNFFPTPVPTEPNQMIFSSFNKGSFQVFKSSFEGKEIKTISFKEREPGKEYDQFEPTLSFNIEKDKIKPYKGIGKLYLTSRPPVDTVVSSDGSIYGGSSVTFTDLLANHTFSLTAYQVRNFRSYYFSYLNQKNRFQYQASAFQYTMFYYPSYAYYAPSMYQYMSYRDAIATREVSGITFNGYYPLNKYYRLEGSVGFYRYEEDFYDPYMKQLMYYSGRSFGRFWNGNLLSASASITGETTRFQYFGPMAGNTFRLSLSQSIPVSQSFLQNTTVEADYRHYFPVATHTLFAFRIKGFASRGKNPYLFYFGGNNQVRSAYYLNIIANEGWYANLEFRFPTINSASTLIGQIGPVRGTLFFDIARAKLKGREAKIYSYTDDPSQPYIASDAIGSYGFGFEFFFLGLPVHLEFVKSLYFPDITNIFDYNTSRDFQTKFWIGFDF
ncbi:PD40 domain-containing protein [bacterium]|nr:PD40 domain-containing protein [bacterium]